MGRNRKPKAIAERDGSFEAHPARKANYANEPKPDGPLGAPPQSFDPDSYAGSRLLGIWNELVAQAHPGVLTSSDRIHVELACRLIHRIRREAARSGDYNTLKELLGKMAMNPADRPKVQVGAGAAPPSNDDAPKANPFTQIAEEARQEAGQHRPN